MKPSILGSDAAQAMLACAWQDALFSAAAGRPAHFTFQGCSADAWRSGSPTSGGATPVVAVIRFGRSSVHRVIVLVGDQYISEESTYGR